MSRHVHGTDDRNIDTHIQNAELSRRARTCEMRDAVYYERVRFLGGAGAWILCMSPRANFKKCVATLFAFALVASAACSADKGQAGDGAGGMQGSGEGGTSGQSG